MFEASPHVLENISKGEYMRQVWLNRENAQGGANSVPSFLMNPVDTFPLNSSVPPSSVVTAGTK